MAFRARVRAGWSERQQGIQCCRVALRYCRHDSRAGRSQDQIATPGRKSYNRRRYPGDPGAPFSISGAQSRRCAPTADRSGQRCVDQSQAAQANGTEQGGEKTPTGGEEDPRGDQAIAWYGERVRLTLSRWIPWHPTVGSGARNPFAFRRLVAQSVGRVSPSA